MSHNITKVHTSARRHGNVHALLVPVNAGALQELYHEQTYCTEGM